MERFWNCCKCIEFDSGITVLLVVIAVNGWRRWLLMSVVAGLNVNICSVVSLTNFPQLHVTLGKLRCKK